MTGGGRGCARCVAARRDRLCAREARGSVREKRGIVTSTELREYRLIGQVEGSRFAFDRETAIGRSKPDVSVEPVNGLGRNGKKTPPARHV